VSELFASGRVVDLILVLVAAEALLLWWRHRRGGRAPDPGDVASNLAAGVCLLLALRGALVGAWWGWIALCLSSALLAHAADLARRARSG